MKGDGVGRSLISSPRYFFGDRCSPIPHGRFWVPLMLSRPCCPSSATPQSMHTTHAQARQRHLCAASCIDAGVFQPRLGLQWAGGLSCSFLEFIFYFFMSSVPGGDHPLFPRSRNLSEVVMLKMYP